MKYKSEEEITAIIRAFEDATIDRDAWGHSEHMLVALHYLADNDLESATKKMRKGILKLLTDGFGVDLTKEMPYHETMTIFWMRTVAKFKTGKNGASLLELANEAAATFDKDYPLKFYSREFLFSVEARFTFVEGDIGN